MVLRYSTYKNRLHKDTQTDRAEYIISRRVQRSK